ncbi:hypothetical protein [Kitasatospora sp. NPDC059827]|uniref:hypothetical protein n=1 Tax=Kitasatospora sp. NPDC059827 TaxID=3346964 RepID=UPI00364DB3F4
MTGQSGAEGPLTVMESNPPGITASACLECRMFDGWASQYAREGDRDRVAWVGRQRDRHHDPLCGECADPTRSNGFVDPEDGEIAQ